MEGWFKEAGREVVWEEGGSKEEGTLTHLYIYKTLSKIKWYPLLILTSGFMPLSLGG